MQLEDVVLNGSGTVGHTGTLKEWALLFLIMVIVVYMMHKWDVEWRDPVRRKAMLVFHGLRYHK